MAKISIATVSIIRDAFLNLVDHVRWMDTTIEHDLLNLKEFVETGRRGGRAW